MVRILGVDDEKSIRETLSWMLEKEGYSVTCATNFENGKKMIFNQNFDIFFINLILPGGNGIDLIRFKKELKKSGIVIVISGYLNMSILKDSTQLNIYNYFKKPINKDKLLNIVRNALTKYKK